MYASCRLSISRCEWGWLAARTRNPPAVGTDQRRGQRGDENNCEPSNTRLVAVGGDPRDLTGGGLPVHAEPDWVLAGAALCSGAALVTSVLLGLSLAVTITGGALLSATLIGHRLRTTTPRVRSLLRRRFVFGVAAGIAATAAYDLGRLSVVLAAGLHTSPFEMIPRFGMAILGPAADAQLAVAIGVLYHVLNGVSFAIAYVILFGGRPWGIGVAWAFGLELLMLLVYPRWLGVASLGEEFTIVSGTGHLCYGAVIGLVGQRANRVERFAVRRDRAR